MSNLDIIGLHTLYGRQNYTTEQRYPCSNYESPPSPPPSPPSPPKKNVLGPGEIVGVTLGGTAALAGGSYFLIKSKALPFPQMSPIAESTEV